MLKLIFWASHSDYTNHLCIVYTPKVGGFFLSTNVRNWVLQCGLDQRCIILSGKGRGECRFSFQQAGATSESTEIQVQPIKLVESGAAPAGFVFK